MEDPKYISLIPVGGRKSSYSFAAFPKEGLQAGQSLILTLQFTDEESPALPFDMSSSTPTLFVSAYNTTDFDPVMLAGGVLSDSGGGVVGRFSFRAMRNARCSYSRTRSR